MNKINQNRQLACNQCAYTCYNVTVMEVHISLGNCANRKRAKIRRPKVEVETKDGLAMLAMLAARTPLADTEVDTRTFDISEIDFTLDMLNRRSLATLNLSDMITEISKDLPYELYERIYREAYGPNFSEPHQSKEIDSAFRRTTGDFLNDQLLKIPQEQRPFCWISVPSDDKSRRVLFVRHDNKWIPIREKDWKLAFAYSEFNDQDEDVQGCIAYQIISTFLTDIILNLRKHQMNLVRSRVDINLLKALVDFEDNKLSTKFYLLSIFLECEFGEKNIV